jgi:hypothetical protein
MTATGHALIGTVIAAKVGNPVIAIPIAIASHFLADAIPHWDTGYHRQQISKQRFFIKSVLDVILGFVLSYILIFFVFPSTSLAYAFKLILMSQLPDWLTAPYLFLGLKSTPFCWFYKMQKTFDSSIGLPWGFINQAAVVIAIILLGKFI